MRDPNQFKKIITNLAYKFARSTGEPLEDLIQEGYIQFIQKTIEEETIGLSCSFEAALTNAIKQEFLDIYRKKWVVLKRAKETVELGENDIIFDPTEILEAYSFLSPQKKEIVEILIESPKELLSLWGELGNLEESVKRYLRRYRGWKFCEINRVFDEISLFS